MTTPIEHQINLTVRCTKCGAGFGKCDCWPTVTLRCPKCKRTKRAPKCATDPPNTFYVESPCDKCDSGGDKPETMYFDSQNRQLHPQSGALLRRGA